MNKCICIDPLNCICSEKDRSLNFEILPAKSLSISRGLSLDQLEEGQDRNSSVSSPHFLRKNTGKKILMSSKKKNTTFSQFMVKKDILIGSSTDSFDC